MGAPKPCFGYPSRTEAIMDWRRNSVPFAEIARRLDITEKTARSLEFEGRRARKRRGTAEEVAARGVLFPESLIDRLRPHAVARQTTVHEVVRLIVKAVVKDDLVAAVLDDGIGGGVVNLPIRRVGE